MTQLTTTINGYRVELDTHLDVDGTTGCWISKKCMVDGSMQECTASLEALRNGAYLLTPAGYDGDAVPAPTLALIDDWADEYGY